MVCQQMGLPPLKSGHANTDILGQARTSNPILRARGARAISIA
jgi:hypothetical protein